MLTINTNTGHQILLKYFVSVRICLLTSSCIYSCLSKRDFYFFFFTMAMKWETRKERFYAFFFFFFFFFFYNTISGLGVKDTEG